MKKKRPPAKKKKKAKQKTRSRRGIKPPRATAPSPPHREMTAAPNATDFLPGRLVEYGEGLYGIVYAEFPDSPLFEAKGLQGGGYTWHGMVVHLLEQSAPHHVKAIEFDPEGSMLAARSGSLEALRAVSAALAQLEDVSTLERIVSTVDLSKYD